MEPEAFEGVIVERIRHAEGCWVSNRNLVGNRHLAKGVVRRYHFLLVIWLVLIGRAY